MIISGGIKILVFSGIGTILNETQKINLWLCCDISYVTVNLLSDK
jgi:hypothetical protein